jgi:hypothetical protein
MEKYEQSWNDKSVGTWIEILRRYSNIKEVKLQEVVKMEWSGSRSNFLFTKSYYVIPVEEVNSLEIYSKHGRNKQCIRNFSRNLERKRPLARSRRRWQHDIQMALKKYNERVWTGCTRLRIGSVIGLLRTFRLHKRLEISWRAAAICF